MNFYDMQDAADLIEKSCGLSDSDILNAHQNAEDTVIEKTGAQIVPDSHPEACMLWFKVFSATINSYK